jgi:hypothetical protein
MRQVERIVAATLAGVVVSGAAAQDAVQWRVEDGGNGHWYLGIPGIISWTDARSDSLAAGGDLVSLDEPGEFQALIDHVLDPNRRSLFHPENEWGPHIGGIQSADAPDYSEPDGGWSWLNGVAIDCNADPCKLDNCCGGQDRLALASVPMGSFTYSFNDTTPSAASAAQPGYVIEWSADCNADGIVDYGQILDGTFADTDGNGVPDCCDDGSCIPPVQWRVEDGGNGHWYKKVAKKNGVDSFETSVTDARARGGDLASIAGSGEDVFSSHLAQSSAGSGVAIGARIDNAKCPNGFIWTDGTEWDYVNWGLGQPNCVVGEVIGYWDSGWHDLAESDVVAFIYEWSADCNGDGLVDYGQILDGTYADENDNGVPDCCDAGEQCDPCIGDLNGDGVVGPPDLGILLAVWGTVGGDIVAADITGEGRVNASDLGPLLGAWGFCP